MTNSMTFEQVDALRGLSRKYDAELIDVVGRPHRSIEVALYADDNETTPVVTANISSAGTVREYESVVA